MDPMVTAAELACLGAALSWAVSLTLFRGLISAHGARAVNLVKCLMATVLLGATTVAAGQLGPLLAAPGRDLALVAASGVLGLSVGDSALFASVQHIGVYRTLLLQSLAPVFTAVLAAVLLGERLTVGQGIGAAVILAGVTLVVVQKGRTSVAARRSLTGLGVGFGLLAAFGQGAGIVLVKQGMAQIPPLPASFLRMTAAAFGLALMVTLAGRIPSAWALVTRPAALLELSRPTLLGSYFGFLAMTVGIAYAPASVAAVLLATTPVFSLFIEARLTGERIRTRSLVGTLLTVAGIGLLALPGG